MNQKLYLYLTLLPQFLTLFPPALLCYLPMKNRLKYSPAKTAALCLVCLVPYVLTSSVLYFITEIDINIILFPFLVLFFCFYKHSIQVDLSCALSVYVGVCTLMSFPAQFSYAFDAWLHPASNAADFSMWAGLFQLTLSCLITALLVVPCSRLYSYMVEQLSYPRAWYPMLTVHGILLLFNILMIPHSYETLYTGRAFTAFLELEIVLFFLFLFLHVVFYQMANVILKHAELTERSRLLEMQTSQYQRLQNYMQQTRRLRHDFRQSVHILTALADKDDLPGLKAHLQEYEQQWDTEALASYCSSPALNALFNYYKEMADTQKIKTDWKLSLPETLDASELDLASLFGNLMENAVAGCMTVPEADRHFALSVEIRQENYLYIVSTNSFNGHAKKSKNRYLSTKHGGEGLGLLSISSIAQKYQGYARISHNEHEFFADVMLKI